MEAASEKQAFCLPESRSSLLMRAAGRMLEGLERLNTRKYLSEVHR